MNAHDWQVSGYPHRRELGSGASGRVTLAVHDATGTPTAIKYLVGKVGDDPSLRAAFRARVPRSVRPAGRRRPRAVPTGSVPV